KRREVYEDREDLPTRPAFFLALPAVESGSNGSGPGLEYLLRPAQAGTSATGPVARTARDATSNQGALRLAQPIGSGDLPRLPRHDRDDPPASPCPSRDAHKIPLADEALLSGPLACPSGLERARAGGPADGQRAEVPRPAGRAASRSRSLQPDLEPRL